MKGQGEEGHGYGGKGSDGLPLAPADLNHLRGAAVAAEEDLPSRKLKKPLFHTGPVAARDILGPAVRTRKGSEDELEMVGHGDRSA